jgi:putative transposase
LQRTGDTPRLRQILSATNCDKLSDLKYLNNVVEQDHRAVKRVTRPMLGFKAFEAAQSTLVGIELMHMIKKRQLVSEVGTEGLTAAEQFYTLAA